MVMSDQLPNPYLDRFKELLVRGAAVAQARIDAEGPTAPISDDARERAQNVLSYTLKEATAWRAARDLLLTMAPKMEAAGYRQEWLAYLNDGLWQSEQQGDQAALAALQFQCGSLHRLLSNHEQAHALLSASIAYCAAAGETAGQARALNQLAYLAWQQHRHEEAERFAQAALQIVGETSLERAMSLSALGLVAYNRSRYTEAEKYHYEALLLRTDHNAQKEMAWSLQNLGLNAAEQGKYEVAVEYYTRALTLLDKVYDPAHRAIVQMNLGGTYYRQKAYAQALDILNPVEQELRRLSDELNLAKLLTTKGLCYLAQQHWAFAQDAFRTSADLFHRIGDFSWYLNAYDGLGISYLERAQYAQALAIFETIVAQLPQIEGTPAHKHLAATVETQITQAKAKLGQSGASADCSTQKQA